MIAALLLLAVAPVRLTMMDDVVSVPHGEWRALPIVLVEQPGRLESSYRVIHGDPLVRLALTSKEEGDALRHAEPHTELAATSMAAEGTLRFPIRSIGQYELIVDNRENRSDVELHLTASLVFGDDRGLTVRYASPKRRAAAISLSLVFFFTVAGYTGVKLRRALDDRPPY